MIRLIPRSIFEINLHDPSLLMNIYHEWENVVKKEKEENKEYVDAYNLLYPCGYGFDVYVTYGSFNSIFSKVPLKTNIRNPLIKKFAYKYAKRNSNISFVIGRKNLKYVDKQFFKENSWYKQDGIFIMTAKQIESCGNSLDDIASALHLNFIDFHGMPIAFTTIYVLNEMISLEKAFNKWKTMYMDTLRTWVDNLPDQKDTQGEVEAKDIEVK